MEEICDITFGCWDWLATDLFGDAETPINLGLAIDVVGEDGGWGSGYFWKATASDSLTFLSKSASCPTLSKSF